MLDKLFGGKKKEEKQQAEADVCSKLTTHQLIPLDERSDNWKKELQGLNRQAFQFGIYDNKLQIIKKFTQELKNTDPAEFASELKTFNRHIGDSQIFSGKEISAIKAAAHIPAMATSG